MIAWLVQAVDELTVKWEEAWYLREQEVQDEREHLSDQLGQQQHQASTPCVHFSRLTLCLILACLLNIISFNLCNRHDGSHKQPQSDTARQP